MSNEFIQDGDVLREVVIMLTAPCDGNPTGEVRIYRDELPEGAQVKGDALMTSAPKAARTRATKVESAT